MQGSRRTVKDLEVVELNIDFDYKQGSRRTVEALEVWGVVTLGVGPHDGDADDFCGRRPTRPLGCRSFML